jgi:hypothetical protein
VRCFTTAHHHQHPGHPNDAKAGHR